VSRSPRLSSSGGTHGYGSISRSLVGLIMGTGSEYRSAGKISNHPSFHLPESTRQPAFNLNREFRPGHADDLLIATRSPMQLR
jgi:hypothetical protein